jgi:hypothetical protein
MHELTNEEMEVALRLRLQMGQKYARENVYCNCRKDTRLKVDVSGIHWACGCSKDGVRIYTHDRLKEQIQKILSYASISSKLEQHGLFDATHPDTKKRMDITAFGLPNYDRTVLLDIGVTSPVPPNGGILSVPDSRSKLRAAEHYVYQKNHKYRQIADANNFGFLPLIFEATGAMHPSAIILLKSVLEQAANARNLPFIAAWRFWISSLVICIQRGLARAILVRSRNVRGFSCSSYQTSNQSILGFGLVHSF